MKAVLYTLLGAIALRLVDYILVIYAEQEPVLCDGGEEHPEACWN